MKSSYDTDTKKGVVAVLGGEVAVTAGNDGFRAVNKVQMDGGNGAIDYAGTFTATGGTLFAAGSAEMAQSISDSSDVCAVAIGVEAQENTAVRLLRADGSAICSFVPKKRFSHLVIVSPEIQAGESYTVQTAQFSGGTNADGLLSDAVYTDETEIGTFTAQTGSVPVGNAGGGFGKFGGGQHGGTPNGEQPHDLPQNANPPDGNVPAPNGGERPNAENRPNRGAPQENG